uniref:Leucine-rich repeat protein SHOC-2 n=1 Tax=Ciona savignyi TaxID=51511 RepID=H2Z0S2_CIOSA
HSAHSTHPAHPTYQLTTLIMGSNKMVKFPEWIFLLLPHLKYLDLQRNSIQKLSFSSRWFWQAKRLEWLDVSDNNLNDVSMAVRSINAQWSSTLRKLNLANNKIKVLPPAIGNLTKLEILNVSHNLLTSLPNEVGHLSSTLTQLSIEGNHLDLDPAVLKGSTRDLCGFLFARLKRSVPNNRVKLMLIGDPRAGKTTLLHSLMKTRSRKRSLISGYSGATPDKEVTTLATVGVDVNEWKLKHKNKLYSVSAWDFAGQEDFYATHPCFLSERAMYIAVYDASRSLKELQTLKPWLAAVHARASHCPVLIVGSHADRISNVQLYPCYTKVCRVAQLYPRYFKVCRVYSYTYVLSKYVECTVIPVLYQMKGHTLVGNMVPSSYVELENLLRAEAVKRDTFPVISFTELADVVHGCHSDVGFENGAELLLAVRYLHQTGALLHFDDPRSRLCDYFFIKPAWLCQMFGSGGWWIVTMKEHKSYKLHPFVNKSGILSRKIFSQHFLEQVIIIPLIFLPQLFRLLENFEIVLWQGGDNYLVPSQLPTHKPPIQPPIPNPGHQIIRYFSMIYVPMGFWSR